MKQAFASSLEKHINLKLKIASTRAYRSSTKKSNQRETNPGIQNIIAIASGKGGVGKSTVTANFGSYFAENGFSVVF